MWYYYTNNQQFGPVSEEEIARLIQNGTIVRDTFLWTEGLTDWAQASQTKFSNLLAKVPPAAIARPAGTSYPYPYPVITFQPQSLRTLWLWLAWLVGLGFPFSFICIGFPAVIAGVVLGYILLYRSWLLIQDGRVRTTPGKAVGFCFIPFYNFYWLYVAFVGLSKDMNSYCQERQIAAPIISEGMALAYYIMSLLSAIPYVGILFAIPAIVMYIILMKQYTDAGIRILEHKMQAAAQ